MVYNFWTNNSLWITLGGLNLPLIIKTYAEVMGSTMMHSQIALALQGMQAFQQSRTPTLHKLFLVYNKVGHEDGNAIVI